MKLAIGCDHTAVDLKKEIIEYVKSLGHEIDDLGPYTDEKTDYPIYGQKVAKAVANKEYDGGILICGTGVGISIAANKVKGIRAVCCSEPYSAKLSKQHNDSNIVAFGARVVGSEMAKMIVKEWLDAEYEGSRHQRRVDMITEVEEDEHDLEADLKDVKINC